MSDERTYTAKEIKEILDIENMNGQRRALTWIMELLKKNYGASWPPAVAEYPKILPTITKLNEG